MNTSKPNADPADAANWARIASAASLIASGALLLTGRRKAGLLVAATGTALALVDQQEMVKKWWDALPAYIGEIQDLLNQAEGAVEELAAQRQKLGDALGR